MLIILQKYNVFFNAQYLKSGIFICNRYIVGIFYIFAHIYTNVFMKNEKNITELFFEPVPTEFVPDEQYQSVAYIPDMCKKMARMNNKSVYVIDYSKQKFLYVSSHPLFLCGYTHQEVKEMGYTFYEKVIPPRDLQMLLEINKFGWDLFNTVPPAERTNAYFSYDFFLNHKNGTRILVNQKLSPLHLTANNNMWLALCTVNLSSQKSNGNVIFTLNETEKYYSYDFEKKKIIEYDIKKLSKREKEVFALMMRGFTDKEISKEFCFSKGTVHSHRKHIISKLGENNIANAISIFHSQF